MNNRIKLCTAVALLVSSGFASAASGTCGSPVNLNVQAAPITNLAGNSCTGSSQATSICASFDYSAKKEDIYSFTLAAGFTATAFTLSSIQAGYTPSMYVTSSACATADNCDALGTTSVSLAGLSTATPYFLIVTTTPAAAPANCGTYNLSSDGTLPVRLKDFSIQ